MLPAIRCLLAGIGLVIALEASAQIYTCTAPDGTRICSDEKCGPDAKIVPGISTKKRAKPGQNGANQPVRAALAPEELERLLSRCNEGDMKACTEWTHGGGPNQLREQERRAGIACDAGSLEDCERRYCADGITDECRKRVLGLAKVTGETWYLRGQSPLSNAGVSYQIRCLVEDVRKIHDATIDCAGPPGPTRCELLGNGQRFGRLDQAAASFCRSLQK